MEEASNDNQNEQGLKEENAGFVAMFRDCVVNGGSVVLEGGSVIFRLPNQDELIVIAGNSKFNDWVSLEDLYLVFIHRLNNWAAYVADVATRKTPALRFEKFTALTSFWNDGIGEGAWENEQGEETDENDDARRNETNDYHFNFDFGCEYEDHERWSKNAWLLPPSRPHHSDAGGHDFESNSPARFNPTNTDFEPEEDEPWVTDHLRRNRERDYGSDYNRSGKQNRYRENWCCNLPLKLDIFDQSERFKDHQLDPTLYAAKHGHIEPIRVLLQLDKAGETQLVDPSLLMHCAAYFGRVVAIETARQLLGPFSLWANDARGRAPIHYAAMNGHVETLEALVRLDAEIDVVDETKMTAMCYAAQHGHLKMIEALIRMGSQAHLPLEENKQPSADSFQSNDLATCHPIHSAARFGQVAVVELLVQLNAKCLDVIGGQGWCAMHLGAEYGHVPVIETLARLGSTAIDLQNEYGVAPMHLAADNGHDGVIETLVRLGSRALEIPDGNRQTPMHYAAHNGHVEVIETLVRLGSTSLDAQNSAGETPMLLAARHGFADVVDTLFRLGSRACDTPDEEGMTPLHEAARNGRSKVVQMLIDMGCNTEVTNDAGQTPLHSFSCGLSIKEDKREDDLQCFKVLLQHSSHDVLKMPDHEGRTPLNYFGRLSGPKLFKVLNLITQHGCQLSASDVTNPNPKKEASWMHKFAEAGIAEGIELLVRLGCEDIDQPYQSSGYSCWGDENDETGPTPLFAAASRGHVSAIEMLVRLGSKAIDTPNNDGWTPLYAAALDGRISAIEALVRLGSKAIDTPNNDGCTPLYAAALDGRVSVIETLVRLGSKAIDTPDKQGWTPMHFAVNRGNVELIQLLVTCGSQTIKKENQEYPARITERRGITTNTRSSQNCCQRNDIQFGHHKAFHTFSALANERHLVAFANKQGWTLFHLAAQHGHDKVIEMLAREASCTIDAQNNAGATAMHIAAHNGHVKVIETLNRLGSRSLTIPDRNGMIPLHDGVFVGHSEVVETLVRLASRCVGIPDKNGWTSLHFAAYRRDLRIFHALVQQDATLIDIPDFDGWTPLHVALDKNHPEIVKALVDRGCRVVQPLVEYGEHRQNNSWADYGEHRQNNVGPEQPFNVTPIHIAAMRGSCAEVELLIQHGGNIDLPNTRGDTPMHLAVQFKQEGVVDVLMRLGSNACDVPNRLGQTPLHLAAKHRALLVEKLLLHGGCQSIDAPDVNGDTPMHLAADQDGSSIVETLIRFGARVGEAADNTSSTPLHLAAKRADDVTMLLLLRHGCRAVDTPDRNRLTPILTADRLYYGTGSRLLCLKLMIAVRHGAVIPTGLSERRTNELLKALNEEEVARLRFQVYFADSLTYLLLCAMGNGPVLPLDPLNENDGRGHSRVGDGWGDNGGDGFDDNDGGREVDEFDDEDGFGGGGW